MKIVVLILTILTLLAGVSLFFLVRNLSQQEERPTFSSPTPTPVGLKTFELIGWAAYWDEQNTLKSLPKAMDEIEIFAPSFYRITSSGSLGRIDVRRREEMLNIARAKGVPIIPVIGDDFDEDRVRILLTNARVQERFRQQLIDEAKKEEFIGWNIGIESITSAQKDDFSDFVQNISEGLQANGLKSYITVFAKDADESFDASLGHDYERIGESADKVILMTYGFSNPGSEPGGQAPLEWYRSVLKYTLATVPMHKIVIGISTHGFDWNNDTVDGYTTREIEGIIATRSANLEYNSKEGSQVAKYNENETEHEIWFEDTQTIIEKIKIAQSEFNINQFALWRIGGEGLGFWDTIQISN